MENREKIKNPNLYGIPLYTGKRKNPTSISLIQADKEGITTEIKIKNIHKILSLINGKTVNWIRVTGMSDPDLIINLIKEFGLNIMDAKDILTTQHIISVEEYNDSIFMVLPASYIFDEKEITEHLAFILGENYIISFQETNYPLFENIAKGLKENSSRIKAKKVDFLLASMLNEIIGNYTDAVARLEDDLEELEDRLLDIKNLRDNSIINIQEKRRESIRLRKLLSPFKDQLAKLLRVDKSIISQDEIPYFKDVYDQLLYILQNIESCREITTSLVDLYLNNNDLKMNFVMKRLTVVATIFIPLTFLVGVWGMNFDIMPELHWKYGYLISWIVMIVIGLLVWWRLKKNNWF